MRAPWRHARRAGTGVLGLCLLLGYAACRRDNPLYEPWDAGSREPFAGDALPGAPPLSTSQSGDGSTQRPSSDADARGGGLPTAGDGGAPRAEDGGSSSPGDGGTATGDGGAPPGADAGLFAPPTLVSGEHHNCFLRAGRLVCWGHNIEGQVGDGTFENRPTPVLVPLEDVVQVTLGHLHSCALLKAGMVACWGDNEDGELGDGSHTNNPRPAPITGLADVDGLWVGGHRTCVRRRTGAVFCWGENGTGQLQDGKRTDSPTALPITLPPQTDRLVLGQSSSCAIRTDGAVACWGGNGHGELGQPPSATPRLMPAAVPGLPAVLQLVAGDLHYCALTATHEVLCWGGNAHGELGDGGTADRPTPKAVPGLKDVTRLFGGKFATCAARAAGDVVCWGYNNSGQLGAGDKVTPASVRPAFRGLSVKELALGWYHGCAATDSAVLCVGLNDRGQLGDATIAPRVTPAKVLLP